MVLIYLRNAMVLIYLRIESIPPSVTEQSPQNTWSVQSQDYNLQIQMSIRQVKRKQSTILLHPSASLHLVQLSKLIQDYQHARMLYSINLNAGIVQAMLPEREPSFDFNMSLDVPYIQSEHYESHDTFAEGAQSSLENFTDEEDYAQGERATHRKVVVLQEEQQEFREEDFKFVSKHSKTSHKGTNEAPFNSTNNSEASGSSSKQEGSRSKQGGSGSMQQNIRSKECGRQESRSRQEDLEVFRLQETAYFSQTPHQDSSSSMIYERMKESSKQNKPERVNRKEQRGSSGWSKKAMFLNKIEKEKSRKEIAELINRERHHLKRFLK